MAEFPRFMFFNWKEEVLKGEPVKSLKNQVIKLQIGHKEYIRYKIVEAKMKDGIIRVKAEKTD